MCVLQSGLASQEHIFPQWLLNELGIRDTQISPTRFSHDGTIKSTRSHKMKNLVAGRVCENCNNGWMSQLKNSAKPHLINLFSNETSVVQCEDLERFVIACWAFKTALTLNLGSDYHKNIPKSHYNHIFNDASTLPDHTAVFAQNHHFNQNFYWLQGAS